MTHPQFPWKRTGRMRWKRLAEHDPKTGEGRVLQEEYMRHVMVSDDPLFDEEFKWVDVPEEQ